MNPQETFVTRLRRQRMRARVSLEQIAETLRIKPEILEAFENNDLSEWPQGPVRARVGSRLRACRRSRSRRYRRRVLPAVSAGRPPCRRHDSGDRRHRRLAVGIPGRVRPSRRAPRERSADRRGAEAGLARVRHAARPRAVEPADRSPSSASAHAASPYRTPIVGGLAVGWRPSGRADSLTHPT